MKPTQQTRATSRGIAGAFVGLSGLLITGGVLAQDRAGQVEEIVVTAQRREENLQKVPIAVSAFSAAELETKAVTNSTQLLSFIPNVIAFNNGGQLGQANYFFRGVGTPDGLQTFDSPVVTYLDDVPLGRIVSANINFMDLERVEVLRGPQGTLFGRNVTGGAVVYTSRKPADHYRATLSAEYGSRNHYEGHGSVDVPLGDKVFTNFAVYGLKEDAWRTSVLNNQKFGQQYGYGGRAAVRFVPNDRLEWNVSIDYSEQEGANFSAVGLPSALVPAGTSVPNANNKGGLSLGAWNLLYTKANSCRIGARKTGNIWALSNCVDSIATNQGITSNLQWTISPDFTLNFITGARQTGENYALDFSGNAPGATFREFLLANDSVFKQFSQEIKATGSVLSNRIKYVGGLFFFREDDKSQIDYYYDFPALGYNTLGRVSDDYLTNSTASYAAYLQADTVITDQLTLTLGGRYTHDVKHVSVNYFAYNPAGRNPAGDYSTKMIAGAPRIGSNRFTPRVSAQYQFTPDIMAFASFTKGFKSGGWSGRSATPAGFNSFGDEVVTSYEIGARTELFDRRLRLNLTLFRAEYAGLQINTAYTPPGASVQVFVTGNAGDGYDQGLEAESQFVITRELTGRLSIGVQHSEYTRLDGPAIAASGFNVGGPLSQAPPFSAAGGLTWAKDIEPLRGNVSLSADFQYLPSYNPKITGSSIPTEKNFILNGQISYQPTNSNVEFSAECRNCTYHYYILSTSRTGGGVLGVIPFVGVKVKYKM